MVVALLTLDLFIHASCSLKDKRRVLSGLLDKTKARFNVSIAEVAYQDNHKRATIAVVCVGCNTSVVQGTLDSVGRLFDAHGEAEVTARTLEFL